MIARELGPDERATHTEWARDDAARLQRALAEADAALGLSRVEDALAELGLDLDPRSPAFRRLGFDSLRMQVQALNLAAERRRGLYREDAALTPPPPLASWAAEPAPVRPRAAPAALSRNPELSPPAAPSGDAARPPNVDLPYKVGGRAPIFLRIAPRTVRFQPCAPPGARRTFSLTPGTRRR